MKLEACLRSTEKLIRKTSRNKRRCGENSYRGHAVVQESIRPSCSRSFLVKTRSTNWRAPGLAAFSSA